MIRRILFGVLLSLPLALFLGCGQGEQGTPNNKLKVDGSKYLLNTEPPGARDVIEVRKDAKDREEVVIVGRIGGDVDPWIKGLAAFSIVDRSAKPCNEIPGDTCPKPWDYCCEADLPQKTALVKITDETGKLVRHDARELLNVKELQTVVVQGVAERDKNGNLTVLAKAVYVKK